MTGEGDRSTANGLQDDDHHLEFDEETHEMITLDDALEILDQDDGDGDVYMDSDDDDGELHEEAKVAPRKNVKDSSIAHFASHSSSEKGTCSVFCLAMHPTEPCLGVSGGEDDLAYLFRTDTGEEVAKLSGHTDSVVCVGFSSDGELVATGGMDGRVRLWRRVPANRTGSSFSSGAWEFARWEFLTNLEGPDEVTCMAWHPKGPVLAVGSNDGTIWLYTLPSGKLMGIFSGHSAAITDLKWASPSEGKRLVSASADSHLFVWDPKDPTSPPTLRFTPTDARFALEDGITCVAINSAGTLALVGGAQGGALRVVNLASGQFAASLGDAKQGHMRTLTSSIESVAHVDLGVGNAGLWLSAGGDGCVCAWEVGNNSLRWKVEHAPSSSPSEVAVNGHSSTAMEEDTDPETDFAKDKTAVSTLAVHPVQPSSGLAAPSLLVSTASADGLIQTWDARSGKHIATHDGHTTAVHALGISRDNRYIASAGDDGLVRVHAAMQ